MPGPAASLPMLQAALRKAGQAHGWLVSPWALGASIGLALASAVAASAAEVSFQHSFSLGPGETAFALPLPRFDPSAHPETPVLESVQITLTAAFSAGATFSQESSEEIVASGTLSAARVMATPIGAGLLGPDPIVLSLNDSTSVPASGSISTFPQSSGASLVSTSDPGEMQDYTGSGTVGYDIDFIADYPPMVTAVPASVTILLCNARVAGRLTVTYTAAPSEPANNTVKSFVASWAAPGRVVVHWTTGDESNLLGFQLERLSASGHWLRVNEEMVPAKGGNLSNAYRFEEANVLETGEVNYRLLTVGTDGQPTVAQTAIVQVGLKAVLESIPSGLRVSIRGPANRDVQVEAAIDLERGPWIQVGAVALDADGVGVILLEMSESDPIRFYRLVRE
ncbi:MAG TPA: choice-of-anchor E domain-containing protein [Candidatus Paceibacterota bacterium]|nr:choice-of-anchor E domain-containing protein [Candidatus Paceibacterota bacterium]